MNFDYQLAFSRNCGVVSESEQQKLCGATFAIAGLGGVGGDYLITLLRAGVGKFKIADHDDFELANFNRQYGATVSAIGRSKISVMQSLSVDVNPQAVVEAYDSGIGSHNIAEFLEGVDVVIDAVEFFEIGVHRMLFDECMSRGIPVVFGVPLGFGASVVIGASGGMSFDEYFDIDINASPALQALKMAIGVAPAGYHLNYLEPGAVDLGARKAPSFSSGCKLASGMVIGKAVQAFLHPDEIRPLPHFTSYDVRLDSFKTGYLFMGNRNPWQRFKFFLARKKLGL